MRIAIIGASRGIGYEMLRTALDEGHSVAVLARNPAKLTITDPNLHAIKGNILDLPAVKETVDGQEGICVCIGIPPTRKAVDVFSRGLSNVLAALKQSPSRRLIFVTGIGTGDSKGHGGFFYDRIIHPLLLKTIYEDKDRAEAIIRESNTDWLIVRPGFLTNGPRTGKYKIIEVLTGVVARSISRADVADFMLTQIVRATYSRKTVLLT